MTVLLLLVLLNTGVARGYTLLTDSTEQCAEMEATALQWIPKFLGEKPEYFVAKCGEIQPFTTPL